MADQKMIEMINQVIEDHFIKNTKLTTVPVKELMPAFISAGIFAKDEKKGLPIRKVLRALDQEGHLELIPSVYADRQEKSIYWYFLAPGVTTPSTHYKQTEKGVVTDQTKLLKSRSDEAYVLDLCDKVLEQKAYRKQKFDFLLGDLHKDGKTKTQLPVGAYYESLKLAVEYVKEEDEYFDSVNTKYNKMTISGMTRGAQRKRYAERKAKMLPEHQIQFVEISSNDFKCNDETEIIRNEVSDIKTVQKALKRFID